MIKTPPTTPTSRSTAITLSVMIVVFLFTSELQAIVGTPNPPPPTNVILPDLPAGTQYQLLFTTSGTTDAINPNLSHYDAIVASYAASIDALLPSAPTWYVIGTSPTEAARDHVPISAPIYNTLGQLLATPDSFWGVGNTNSTLLASVSYDENGNYLYSRRVWTGSKADGTRPSWWTYGFGGSSNGCGEGRPADGKWLASDWSTSLNYTGNSLYGISSPITAVPEPGSMALLTTMAVAGLGLLPRRRSRT